MKGRKNGRKKNTGDRRQKQEDRKKGMVKCGRVEKTQICYHESTKNPCFILSCFCFFRVFVITIPFISLRQESLCLSVCVCG